MTLQDDGESVTKPEEDTVLPEAKQDDDLWNEVASERGGPPADEAAGTDKDPADPDEDVDAKAGSPDSAENTEAAGADDGDPPASQASSDDIWANAPPELKAAFEASQKDWETRLGSVKGRLSAQDRFLDALRTGNGKKVKELLGSDAFKALREEYGDNLRPMFSVVETLAESQFAIDEAVTKAGEARADAHVDEQLGLYAKAHPDWESYGSDDRFGPWLAQQPQAIREAAARNQQFIVDAGDASLVLSRFKEAHGIGAAPPPPPPPPPPPSKDDRRDRQREGGRASDVRGGPAATATDPDNDDALWDSLAAKRERQKQQR